MKYVRLGTTGMRVSPLCLGTMTYGAKAWREWVHEEAESRPFFEKAAEGGLNFFDTADVYSNGVCEEITGRALKDIFDDREDYVIATKCFGGTENQKVNRFGLSRKHIFDACDRSLQRLGVEYIDLYQIHRWDYRTPIEETLEALNDLVRMGKVRYIGASSMFAWQFAKALNIQANNGWATFVSMQNHYNLMYREEEREMIPLCADQGIGMIPWSPLARGFLAGKSPKDGEKQTIRAQTDEFGDQMYGSDNDYAVVERLAEVAARLDLKPMQVALAWILSKPTVSAPIIGASKLHHLDEAFSALDVELPEDEVKALEEVYQPHPVLGHA